MNKSDYIIRRETINDYHEVEELAREAFWNLSVPGCSEHYFMHVLRQHKAFVPELDYVIEINGRIAASVMYSVSTSPMKTGTKKSSLWGLYVCSRTSAERPEQDTARIYLRQGSGNGIRYRYQFRQSDNYVARGYKSCKV